MGRASALTGVRSILETPILDEHKWAKVPSIPTDAVLLDLEDSVAPERKEQARARVLACLDDPTQLGTHLGLPRANALDTPWGHDDLQALAEHGAPLIAYPKLRTADEFAEVQSIVQAYDRDPGIVVIIETAQAVLELETIAQAPGVAGLILGPSDLATDAGWTLFTEDGLFSDAYHYPKSKLSLVGAAYNLPVYDTVFVPDLRDSHQVQAAADHARCLGFTGMSTFYPPHVDIINDVFTPSAEEVAAARATVDAYEDALTRGSAAVQVDGRAVIVQDYKQALRVLEQARG